MTDEQAWAIFQEAGLVRGWERTVYHVFMGACVIVIFVALALGMIMNVRAANACALYGYHHGVGWIGDGGNRPICIDAEGHRMPLRLLQTER